MDKFFGIFLPADEKMHIAGLLAFAQGLETRGIPHDLFPLEAGYQPCDVVVTFGIHKKRTPRGRAVGEIILQHVERNGPSQHMVIERGFIHRDRYFMVGWGGLNGRADFRNADSPANRFQQLQVDVAPWRTQGDHIVLCGQIPWDAAVQDSDHIAWCRNTASLLARLSSRRILFRPHPLQPDAVDMSKLPVKISRSPSLQQDMIHAWAVVTYNSNAGVEATLAGIPAFVSDRGAMGYPILNRELADIESPQMPDRQQWLADLAYTQWTLDEIAMGKAIYHLYEREQSLAQQWYRMAVRTHGQIKTAIESVKTMLF